MFWWLYIIGVLYSSVSYADSTGNEDGGQEVVLVWG